MPVPGDTGSAIRCPQVEEAAEIHQEGEWEPRPQQMAADRGDAQRSSSMQPGAAPASGHCWEPGGKLGCKQGGDNKSLENEVRNR